MQIVAVFPREWQFYTPNHVELVRYSVYLKYFAS